MLITRIAATVMTAGWPNPAKASAAGTRPAQTATINAQIATKSKRKRPLAKSKRVKTMMINSN